jgi:hypothetical protein
MSSQDSNENNSTNQNISTLTYLSPWESRLSDFISSMHITNSMDKKENELNHRVTLAPIRKSPVTDTSFLNYFYGTNVSDK